MATVIGVRFKNVGKMYYFDPGDARPKKGDHAIVETAWAWSAEKSPWTISSSP